MLSYSSPVVFFWLWQPCFWNLIGLLFSIAALSEAVFLGDNNIALTGTPTENKEEAKYDKEALIIYGRGTMRICSGGGGGGGGGSGRPFSLVTIREASENTFQARDSVTGIIRKCQLI